MKCLHSNEQKFLEEKLFILFLQDDFIKSSFLHASTVSDGLFKEESNNFNFLQYLRIERYVPIFPLKRHVKCTVNTFKEEGSYPERLSLITWHNCIG